MDTTWFLHGHHVVAMWTQHSYHMDTTWFPGKHHMVSMCTPCGFQVVTTMHQMWTPYGFHMKSHCFYVDKTWFPYGYHVVTMLTQCGYHMVSRWTPYGFYVDTMWFPGGHHVVFKFISTNICKDGSSNMYTGNRISARHNLGRGKHNSGNNSF